VYISFDRVVYRRSCNMLLCIAWGCCRRV